MPSALVAHPRYYEPRPNILDESIIEMAINSNRDALLGWVRSRGYETGKPTEDILGVFASALRQALGEATRTLWLLELVYGWDVDESLLWHVEVAQKNLPAILYLETMRWIMRTGCRFPARIGDLVVFIEAGFQRVARVVEIDNISCSALGITEDGFQYRVLGELVIENRTSSTAKTFNQITHDL